jgi:rare lipoprotein A
MSQPTMIEKKRNSTGVKTATVAMLALMTAAQLPASAKDASKFSGNISYYGKGLNGRPTASGQKFDMNGMTCAHRTLPFGTKLLVEHPKTGKSVIVTVNDRGPFHGKRVLDLAQGAASKLGILLGGVAYVDITVMGGSAKTEKTKETPSKSYLGESIGLVAEAMPEQILAEETQPGSWL